MPRVRPVPAELTRKIRAQDQVVARPQALALGLTDKQLEHRLRSGRWRRLLPGVYLVGGGAPTRRQLCRAALLWGGHRARLDSWTSLQQRNVRAAAGVSGIHVLCPDRQRRSRQFVVVHRSTRPVEELWLDGLPIVSVARAVVVAAGGAGLRNVRALVAEVVQHRLCTLEQLSMELDSWPRGAVRRALSEVAAGVQSVAEAELMALLQRSGLPPAQYNAELTGPNGQVFARPDVYWPEHGLVVEVDSAEWHLTPADWHATMRRHNRITTTGRRLLHFPPNRIREEPDQVLAEIAAALAS